MSENDIGYSLQEPGWGVPVATKPTIPGVNVKIKKVFPFRSTAPQHQFFSSSVTGTVKVPGISCTGV